MGRSSNELLLMIVKNSFLLIHSDDDVDVDVDDARVHDPLIIGSLVDDVATSTFDNYKSEQLLMNQQKTA